MQIASGKVIDGRVVVEAELPEGADVTLIALDGEETFEVSPELEAIILESMAQGQRRCHLRGSSSPRIAQP